MRENSVRDYANKEETITTTEMKKNETNAAASPQERDDPNRNMTHFAFIWITIDRLMKN